MDTKCDSGMKVDTKKCIISDSKKFGRCLLAAKDLSAGEVILRDEVASVGPAIFDTCSIFCFSCLRPLQPAYNNKIHYACSKCKVAPLCNLFCENSVLSHHRPKECEIFSEKKDLLIENIEALVKILFLLRLLILKEENEYSWQRVCDLEAHLDERRNTHVWQDRQKTVVSVFRKLGLYAPADSATDETLQRLCGIVDVNSFELRCPRNNLEAVPSPLLQGLFLEAALMAHSCRSNVHITVDEHFRMTIYAAVPIAAGKPLFNNYTSSLLGTAERQQHLSIGKYFYCECNVCKDPLEGGTYLSCIICPRCRKDYVAIEKANEANPYGANTGWQCQNCKRMFKGCLIKTTVEISQDLICNVDHSSYKEMENLLGKLTRTFHNDHYVMLALKQKLLAVYRKEMTCMNPQRKILLRMLELSTEVMHVLEIVEPGISRLKGIMLYEMHLPVTILANRAYAAREINAKDLLRQLEEAQKFLKRSLTMLLLEPPNTPEGLLARRALQEMKLLTQNVDDAKALASDLECDMV